MTKYGRTLDVLLFTTLREKDLRPLDLRFYNPRTWGFFFSASLPSSVSDTPRQFAPTLSLPSLAWKTPRTTPVLQAMHCSFYCLQLKRLFTLFLELLWTVICLFLLFSNCHRSKSLVVSISMKIVSNNKRVSDSISCMLYICVIEKKAKRSWGFERAAKPIPRLLHNRTHPGSAWKGL